MYMHVHVYVHVVIVCTCNCPFQYPPTRQLSFKEKQQLVRLCSDISNVDDEVVQVEENVLEDYDDIEVESMMMSQVDWNENETEQEHELVYRSLYIHSSHVFVQCHLYMCFLYKFAFTLCVVVTSYLS